MTSADCPAALKGIAHYLKIAEDHDQRDVVISYWCRLYALEVAMQISSSSKTPEMNKYLLSIMDWLEKIKGQNPTNECITNKTCAQSYVENYSLKLFSYGDEQDQAENYGKNVVKAFYTAGILMDVLSTFGELDEEMSEKRKYAKWKAAYIHNCLKVGERPTPGSFGHKQEDFKLIDNQQDFNNVNNDANDPFANLPQVPQSQTPSTPSANSGSQNFGGFDINSLPQVPQTNTVIPNVDPLGGGGASYVPPAMPQSIIHPIQPVAPVVAPTVISGATSGASLTPEQMQKAQKYCKWATSALNYDDVNTAILNLQKALMLLQTGNDPPQD